MRRDRSDSRSALSCQFHRRRGPRPRAVRGPPGSRRLRPPPAPPTRIYAVPYATSVMVWIPEEPSSDCSHDPCRRIGPSVGTRGAKNWTGGPGRMTTGTMVRCEERPMRSSAVGCDVDRGMTGTDQEATLLARIARRDATAFETLYDRYSRAVYSLALRMLGNPQAAQEVAQEIFLHIWRGAGEFIPARGSARSWVLSLAHHRSVDALRRQRVRAVEPLAEGDRSAGGGADVVEQALRGVEGAAVRSALMTLSADQREAIVLRSEEHTSELQSRQYLVCRL